MTPDTNHIPRRPTTRRQALGAAGALGAAAVLAQVRGPQRLLETLGLDAEAQAATTSCVLIPAKTQGPYFVDEELNRSDIRADTSTGAVQSGVPLTLKLIVVRSDGDCAPVPGAVVDVWHANAAGLYSDVVNVGAGGSQVGRTFLRGYQKTDDDGAVSFTTIYPGWYSGRAIHIHFKVRLYDGSSETYEFTSQLFFDPAVTSQVLQTRYYSSHGTPDTSNSTDDIYGSDGSKLLVPLTGSSASGFAGTFVIGLSGLPSTTTTTTTTSGSTGTSNAVGASIGARTWRRTATGRRILRLTVDLDETVALSVRLSRNGHTLARRTVERLRSGSRTVDLRLPLGTAGGRARLSVTFRDAAGASKTVTRTVTVPRRAT